MSLLKSPAFILLFTSFLRLGITSFGGPAMIAYIRRMSVEQKRWLDDETFRAGVALCQFIPGASAMQMAAYVGLRARGIAGAAVCYIAFGLPAFLLITVQRTSGDHRLHCRLCRLHLCQELSGSKQGFRRCGDCRFAIHIRRQPISGDTARRLRRVCNQ